MCATCPPPHRLGQVDAVRLWAYTLCLLGYKLCLLGYNRASRGGCDGCRSRAALAKLTRAAMYGLPRSRN